MKKLYFFSLLLIYLNCFGQAATEAKIYQNYPKGMQMVQFGYLLQTSNATIDGNLTIPNNEIDVKANIGYIRYASFFDIAGKTAALQIMLPYADINAEILGIEANKSGMGDIMVVVGSNILGGNSMTFPQFIQSPKKTALAWSFAVSAPTGKYASDKLLNPGNNRWQFKPELALTIPLGNFDIETYAHAKFFSKNNDALQFIPNQNANILEQKPFYGLTFHTVYNFSSKFWIAFDAASRIGGETIKNSIHQKDSQTLLGLGGTLTYSPSIHHQFGASYMSNAAGNDYAPDGSLFNVKYSYVFGGKIRETMNAIKNTQNK